MFSLIVHYPDLPAARFKYELAKCQITRGV